MNLDFLNAIRIFNEQSALDLLKSGGMIVFSWAPQNFKLLKVGNRPAAFQFDVSGYKFEGTIILSVNGADYYDARFFKDDEQVHEITDMYVGDVINSIDEFVEKQPEYVR